MTNANAVVNALKGKSVEEVMASGQTKLAGIPSGGAAPAAAQAASSAPAPATEAPQKEEKKKEESEDEDMGFGLFD